MKKTVALLLFLALLLTAALPAWAEDAASRRITLSGKAEETFTAEQNCYAEGERALVFIQKGLTLPCDVITTVEGAMAELEAATGLSFDTFLVETYGKEIIPGLLKAVTDSGFDSSYGEDEAADRKADSEQMKTILRTLCGEDVFERFAKWHESEMPRVREEYRDYMRTPDAA